MDDWKPPANAKIHIVCAANRRGDVLFVGPRHCDDVMRAQVATWAKANDVPEREAWVGHEQGFIDQFGRFWTREQAMQIVRDFKQPFDPERNGGNDRVLFSEGLY